MAGGTMSTKLLLLTTSLSFQNNFTSSFLIPSPSFSYIPPHHTTSSSSLLSSTAADASSQQQQKQQQQYNTILPDTSKPLSPQTLAGQIERTLLSKFNPTEIERIITSWRLLDQDYEHREFVGPQQDPPITPSDPNDSNCHQLAPSYVPGLPARAFWDVEKFDWCIKLRDSYQTIKEEFTRVTTADAEKLVQEGNNVWSGALTDEASGYGEGWKTLVLKDKGIWDVDNVNLFPRTAKAVQECGVPATEVFFASMKPRTDIKPHSDFTNFVVTSHLALDIPCNGENKCRLTIGDETRQWRNGEVMMFDTSIMHDAVNESDETRYILMLRLWHPDLMEVEREALQFLYDAIQVPELVSEDVGVRFMAEERVRMLHSFPNLDGSGSPLSSSSGFKIQDAEEGLSGRKGEKKGKRKGRGGGGGKGFGS